MSSGAFGGKWRGLHEMLHFDNWIVLILDRLLFPKGRLAVYRYGQIEVAVDRSGGDLQSIRTCLADPMYSQFLSKMKLPKEGLQVLDLGSHVGGFILLIRTLNLDLKKVVCVELNPQTVTRLRANLERNLKFETNWSVLNAGVSAQMGELDAEFGMGSTGDSMERCASAGGRRAKVPLVTLDHVVSTHFQERPPDLVKMDIEGAEHDLLASDTCGSLARVPWLIMELHAREGKSKQMTLDHLDRLGFEVVGGTSSQDDPDEVILLRNRVTA